MTVAFRSGGQANERDIIALENAIGQRVSHEFRRFVTSADGAKPELNVFKVNAQIESGINQFIPVERIVAERDNIENLSDQAYPIAWAEGGNYVVLDEGRQGAVFFWDHEVPEAEHKIAASFNIFLDLLRPFDPASIQFSPEQVRSAWINPDFLKKFAK